MTTESAEAAVDRHLDNLMVVLGADSTVTESYEDEGQRMFVALVRLGRTYINWWAERDQDGSISDLMVRLDDLDDPERVNDPATAQKLTLLTLFLDALAYNVGHVWAPTLSGASVDLTMDEGEPS